MCLILFAIDVHPEYQLILAANRDEFYARPTLPLSTWQAPEGIIAGRDLVGMGTWLGISASGLIAAVTNYRDPRSNLPAALSRGRLVSDYLSGSSDAAAYLEQVARNASKFNGYNLLAGRMAALWYFSNRQGVIRRLPPGIYGLSNRLLDTPWPKTVRGTKALEKLVKAQARIDLEALMAILTDQTVPPDDQLPDTGIGLDRERLLSPAFITIPGYGTRSSSVILADRSGNVTFVERTYESDQPFPVVAGERIHKMKLPAVPPRRDGVFRRRRIKWT